MMQNSFQNNINSAKHKIPQAQSTYDIPLVKPLLPTSEAFMRTLLTAWHSGELTNFGPLHQQLEQQLCKRLETPLALVANGTMALTAALKAFSLKGEVITAPFTFAATLQSIELAGLKPVLADIDPETLCLSPKAAQAAITANTCAILPVHVFGTPCDVLKFDEIASTRNIKIIYDAAHAFDLLIGDAPIAQFGDASAFSFHATKLFHTAEGGAVAFSRSGTALKRGSLWRNFGLQDGEVITNGTNAKLSELHCAMGLSVLPLVDQERKQRYRVARAYHSVLGNLPGIQIHTAANAQYFTIQIDNLYAQRSAVIQALESAKIQTRSYFYPALNDQPLYRARYGSNFPHAMKAAQECLCLPFYSDITTDQATSIAEIIKACKR